MCCSYIILTVLSHAVVVVLTLTHCRQNEARGLKKKTGQDRLQAPSSIESQVLRIPPGKNESKSKSGTPVCICQVLLMYMYASKYDIIVPYCCTYLKQVAHQPENNSETRSQRTYVSGLC